MPCEACWDCDGIHVCIIILLALISKLAFLFYSKTNFTPILIKTDHVVFLEIRIIIERKFNDIEHVKYIKTKPILSMIINVSRFKTVNYVRDYHGQNYEHLDKTKIMITYIATRKSALLLHKLGCFQERVKLLPIPMVSSLWLCIITRRLCGCALSLVVFVVVHYHSSVFVVVHDHSPSLWLCIITQ